MTAAPRLPEPVSRSGLRTAAPPQVGATEVECLAVRWAALAPGSSATPNERSPRLHARLVTLLQQIAARCRDEPFWPLRARRLGADVLRSGICGTSSGPRHHAEDVLAPTLALLRDEAPRVLGLNGTSRRRLIVVLDELAAGFAAALRDRVHVEHENLLRIRLAEAAARDALTQLPNRSITEQRVHRAFTGANGVGLCAVDLDGFGGVNDRLGRGVGDRLLVAVAARLRQAVAPHLLTRTGGDEFAVLVEEAPDAGAVHALGCRVRDALGTPFRIGDRTVTLSAAVGVAVAAPRTAGPAELMRAADVALSWAKAQGRGRVVLFDPDHDAAESAQAGLLSQLGDAVARGEFRLHYQPLVQLADGRVRGAEALVRWQHPEHGLLPPSGFVAAAERSGAIVALDRWVLEQACAQAAAWWREHGPAAPYVSVNVSPVELVEPGWAAEVARVIELTGLRPAQLQLEITEQAVLADEAASRAALRTLRDAGVRLALDDFGTGYSGLAWLRRLPVHAIKIDGSFVDGLRHVEPDAVDSAIILAMVRMAHSIGLEVTAEWVETARQADYLTLLGCDLGQGRWFGQAGPAAWVAGVARVPSEEERGARTPGVIPRSVCAVRSGNVRPAPPDDLPVDDASGDDLRADAGPREECGVFGVWAPGEDVAKLTYYGLYALQHRGQEAAGMAVSDGRRTVVFKDLGLVSQVFDEQVLSSLRGHLAVGHVRYSTTGSTTWENAQPTFRTTATGSGLALAHNGNLVNTAELRDEVCALRDGHGGRGIPASTDSDLVCELLAATAADVGFEEAAMRLLPRLRGAFSLVFADEQTLYAARDAQGVRPLVLGRLERGWVVASETAALDIVGASFVREVEPGELLAIDADGMRSAHFAAPEPKGCVFEYVYLARPDTTISGRSVHAARVDIGRRLAQEWPVEADLVIPTPESGTPAAIGYAQGSGLPYGQGLVKNAYVGRTFIQPSQTIRQLGIRLKLNPLRDVIRGKRLVVVDDSIVRGNTQRALVRMLREAGALEVHVRIASPPVRWPCFYGIDFATRAELVASGLDVEGVRRSIGADTLGYISLDGLIAASEQPRTRLCMACFDGNYPIPLPEEARLGKHLLEDLVRDPDHTPAVDVSGAASGDPGPIAAPDSVRSESVEKPAEHAGARAGFLDTLSGWGASDALDRP